MVDVVLRSCGGGGGGGVGGVGGGLHFTAQTLARQTSYYSSNHSAADTELLFRGREQRQNIITSSQLN